MPLIRGYILAAVLGPHVGLNVIHDEESIELIAEIGLVLLLFLIGLEINLPRLRQAGRTLTVNGVLKVPLCAGVAWFALASVAEATSSPFDRPAVSATSSSPCSSSPWVSAFPPRPRISCSWPSRCPPS